MRNKELRTVIGNRIKQRRTELGLSQKYIAEKMEVNVSTINRYEAGIIDNSKKSVIEGLSEALRVPVEWLKGETDVIETKVSDKRDVRIRDLMTKILENDLSTLTDKERNFIKDILILTLQEYDLLVGSFIFGCDNYKDTEKYAQLARLLEFPSTDAYNEMMFLKEVTHSVNAYNDIADVIRMYGKDTKKALMRIKHLLSFYESED